MVGAGGVLCSVFLGILYLAAKSMAAYVRDIVQK